MQKCYYCKSIDLCENEFSFSCRSCGRVSKEQIYQEHFEQTEYIYNEYQNTIIGSTQIAYRLRKTSTQFYCSDIKQDDLNFIRELQKISILLDLSDTEQETIKSVYENLGPKVKGTNRKKLITSIICLHFKRYSKVTLQKKMNLTDKEVTYYSHLIQPQNEIGNESDSRTVRLQNVILQFAPEFEIERKQIYSSLKYLFKLQDLPHSDLFVVGCFFHKQFDIPLKTVNRKMNCPVPKLKRVLAEANLII
jgi:hypothetical protein